MSIIHIKGTFLDVRPWNYSQMMFLKMFPTTNILHCLHQWLNFRRFYWRHLAENRLHCTYIETESSDPAAVTLSHLLTHIDEGHDPKRIWNPGDVQPVGAVVGMLGGVRRRWDVTQGTVEQLGWMWGRRWVQAPTSADVKAVLIQEGVGHQRTDESS